MHLRGGMIFFHTISYLVIKHSLSVYNNCLYLHMQTGQKNAIGLLGAVMIPVSAYLYTAKFWHNYTVDSNMTLCTL